MHILYPSFILMALTAFIAVRLGLMRYAAVKSGEVDPHYYKLYEGQGEPERLRAHTRHLLNLYEAPLLFYSLSVMALVTGQTGVLVMGLCWAYAVLRLVHTTIHLTSNNVLRRFQVFAVSWVVLIALLVTVVVGTL